MEIYRLCTRCDKNTSCYKWEKEIVCYSCWSEIHGAYDYNNILEIQKKRTEDERKRNLEKSIQGN